MTALGVSFITKAQLGTSPISSVPYVLSMGLPLTMGTFTFILNMVLIAGQVMVLQKDFKKIQLVQIPVSVVFGYFIDFTMSLLSFLNPTFYTIKIFFLLTGCIILALGISIQVIADVVMLSAEAFVKGISLKYNKEFGTTKVFFDATLVVISVTISLLLLHKIEGIREGTIIAALVVGFIARFFCRRLGVISSKLLMEAAPLEKGKSVEASGVL